MIDFQSLAPKVNKLLNNAGAKSVQISRQSIDLLTELYTECDEILGEAAKVTFPKTSELFASFESIPTLDELLKKYSFEEISKGSIKQTKRIVNSLANDLCALAVHIDKSLESGMPTLDLIIKISFTISTAAIAIKLIAFFIAAIAIIYSIIHLLTIWILNLIMFVFYNIVIGIAVVYGIGVTHSFLSQIQQSKLVYSTEDPKTFLD